MSYSEEKMNIDVLKILILKKYPTLIDCAEALGISESNLQNKLKTQSNKFLHQLANVGVDIPIVTQVYNNHQNISNNKEDSMNLNLGKNNVVKVSEQKQSYSEAQIAVIEYRVKILEEELSQIKKILYKKIQ